MKKLIHILMVLLITIPVNAQVQVLVDTDLELTGAGGGQWTSTSTNFGNVLCDVIACNNCGGPCVPRSGTYYAWFGGIAATEIGTLRQDFTVATSGVGQLDFWMVMPRAGTAQDSISVTIDGNLAWFKLGIDTAGFENAYAEVTVNLGNLTTGAHTLEFRGASNSGVLYNTIIDDITLIVGGTASTSFYDFEKGIVLYANHQQRTLNLELNFSEYSDVEIMVTDMLGQMKGIQSLRNVQEKSITLSTEGWATGIYQVTLWRGREQFSQKVFIH